MAGPVKKKEPLLGTALEHIVLIEAFWVHRK
jgi:hypothetical protein